MEPDDAKVAYAAFEEILTALFAQLDKERATRGEEGGADDAGSG